MIKVPGLKVPENFYVVLEEPAPLAGMSFPGAVMPWRSIYDQGFSNVVCLCADHVSYNPAPLRVLSAVNLEDLHHGGEPRDPVLNERLVRETVAIIRERLDRGEGVAVHCIGGTGRTGTVLGCVLRSMGSPARDVINYLDEVNQGRGRHWPESIWQARMVQRF